MTVTLAPVPPTDQTPRDTPSPAEKAGRHRLSLAAVARALLVLAVVAGAATYLVPRWTSSNAAPVLQASGTVEAVETSIAAESSGRVRAVFVDEGDRVETGQPLVQLDDTLLQIQNRQAGTAEQQILREQIERLTVRAPRSGIVLRRTIQPGEVALAGSSMMVIADVDSLDLTVYLLQRDIGKVRVGQQVAITTDSLPGSQFFGTVRSISTKAEFTPRNVQTQRDRLNLVFGVKVEVQSDGRLKPGMPVDARVIEEGRP